MISLNLSHLTTTTCSTSRSILIRDFIEFISCINQNRYDLALEGRLRSNATFFDSHAVDDMNLASYAMDLKPLVDDPSMNIAEYVDGCVERFREDVRSRVSRFIGD